MTAGRPSVFDRAVAVLKAAAPDEKTAAAKALRAAWDAGEAPLTPVSAPPDRADMIARFAGSPLLSDDERPAFISDWVCVCDDEARHFGLVCERLSALGMRYGDLPAHDGLWQAAEKTADDFTARLVIAPMVLEARGLDVTPAMISKLKTAGDDDSAAVLQVIYDDEIGHVAAGRKWYAAVCKREKLDETETFHKKVRDYFHGLLKPPFNHAARDLAGMPTEFYLPLTKPAV